ncbi:MAG: HEPN domain-containing protein [Desulfitobacteriaceae bacterium]
MTPEALEWFYQAEYDLETAQVMFDSGRYIYTVFMVHLAIEKSLKALIVERTGKTPPRIHNLVLLLKESNAHLPDTQMKFLVRLSLAGVTTRYPEELNKALQEYPEPVAKEYVVIAREVVKCLKQQVE